MSEITVNAHDLSDYINSLNSGPRVAFRATAKWVKRLTKYTEQKMKRFAKSKSNRSSGKLSSSIKSEYKLSGAAVSGVVFVPEEIKYQFAANYGFKKRFVIQGKPLMAFPDTAWKKARRPSGVLRMGKQGVYIFVKVRRGRYKGKHFVEKAFDSLLKYYTANEAAIISDIGEGLVFAKSA